MKTDNSFPSIPCMGSFHAVWRSPITAHLSNTFFFSPAHVFVLPSPTCGCQPYPACLPTSFYHHLLPPHALQPLFPHHAPAHYFPSPSGIYPPSSSLCVFGFNGVVARQVACLLWRWMVTVLWDRHDLGCFVAILSSPVTSCKKAWEDMEEAGSFNSGRQTEAGRQFHTTPNSPTHLPAMCVTDFPFVVVHVVMVV